MATATKLDDTPPKDRAKDLTRCAICNEIINNPKSLPCLHTFCLDCIREWCQPEKDKITCPVLDCKKTTPIPSNGVDGLPGNVFVASLVARSPSRGRNVPCVCCDETNNDVIARCLHTDCNGFLCKRGFHLHQDKLLKSHQVVKLEDIKSGKVNMKMLADKKQATCKEHEGSPLWFFCETCWVLICRDCTIVEHAKPGHNYVTLKSIASEQRKTIKTLVEQTNVNKTQVESALVDAEKAEEDIDNKKKKTIADIDREIEKIKKHVVKVCEDERKRLLIQQETEVSAAYKKIQSCKETLQSQKVRFQTTSEVANQALKSGLDSDVASVFKQLKDSLEELSKEELQSVPRNAAQLSEFKANSKIATFNSIGDLRIRMPPEVSEATWELECTTGEKNDPGKVTSARGMSTTPTGDLVVANYSPSVPVKVYNANGKYRFSLDNQSHNAWDVTVSRPEGKFYVTHIAEHVRVFGSDGRYVSQFPAISPSGVASNAEETYLAGLAINNNNQLLVGEIRKNYISIHDLNGTHVTSFPLSIQPHFITTTSQGNVVVSPCGYADIHVLDSRGNLQHTIGAPSGVSHWTPRGVCCRINDEICVFNDGTHAGIYCFSSTGEYLRCVTQDVKSYVSGIALLEEDRKMAVSDNWGERVRLFCRE